MEKKLMSGNEAIGRGAIEAGVSLASSYPGTPATEILEYLARNSSIHAQWAINEKVAYETAVGASYAGRRALVSMKHVGVNVISDPLMTSAYSGVWGGLVLAVADDPGAYSSQNEQDSRFYAKFAKIPCFEPCDAQEAKDMVIAGFQLSETLSTPVMVRTVTRISHADSPVETGKQREENPVQVFKCPQRMVAVPAHVVKMHKTLNEKYKVLTEWGGKSGLNKIFRKKGQKKGIIGCGLGYNYAKEYGEDFAVLKISYYPVDEEIIKKFVKGLGEVWVLEECEPFVEEVARRYSKKVKGKMTGEIPMEGELGPDAMAKYVKGWAGKKASMGKMPALPGRPPVMCQGCGHRELYKALVAAGPSFTAGDIGCYTLGFNPPLNAIDTCLCMGAGISQAAGVSLQGVKKVAAVIGDSTFMHAGIPALISAVYNKANILLVILDNSSTAMTGHQPTPLTGITAKGEQGGKVVLEDLCRACGADTVDVVDPFEHDKADALVKERLETDGVKVVISRKPCIFVKR